LIGVTLLIRDAIESCKWEGGDAVFFLCAAADIVDDEGLAVVVGFVADDHDMGEVRWDGAGDDVAGFEIGWVIGDGEAEAATFEEGAQVGDASVVDVAVGAGEVPIGRVNFKVIAHVFVD